jgi:ABC-type bacteriocin/lantibiotic exporter with double-glycine peptidase domain
MIIFLKLFSLLEVNEKINILIIFLLMIINSILELLSIAILIPLISSLFNNTQEITFAQNSLLINFFNFFNLFNIKDLLLVIFCVFIIKNLFILFYVFIHNYFILKIRLRLVNDIYKKYISQDLIFFSNNNSSEILRNVDIAKNSSVIISALLSLLLEILILIVLCSFLLLYNFDITLRIILFFVFSVLLIFFFSKKKLFEAGFQNEEIEKSIKKNVNENIANIKEIKVYGVEHFFLDKFSKLNKFLFKIDLKVELFQQIPKLFIELIAVGLLCYVLFKLIGIVNNQEIIGLLALYTLVIVRLMPSSTRISAALQRIKFFLPQVENLHKIFKMSANKIPSNSTVKKNFSKIVNLKMINISFRYQDHDYIFNNLNLNLKKGTINSIYGGNGSGKSTLLNIILGLLKPTNGRILINGSEKQYKDLIFKSNRIGYVPQNIYLLDDTLKNNIIFGSDLEDTNNLEKSIKNSQLKKLVSDLPKKLLTITGERGIKFSGGQIKKIALARCLYRNSDFLVLDEFNSDLDKNSEKIFLKFLRKNKNDKIIIIVTHAANIKKYCDNVYKIYNKRLIKL